jgi:hypothetical protein
MDPTPRAGRRAPATRSTPDALYERDVRTLVELVDPDTLRVTAHLHDDTVADGGFQAIHDMTLVATVDTTTMKITDVAAGMANTPHDACPVTLLDLQRLVGLRIASGFFGELRRRLGGVRSCNHLHTLAQQVGTVVAVSYAARRAVLTPGLADLPPEEFFGEILAMEPRVVNSCRIWAEDGDLVARLRAARGTHQDG